MSFNSSKNKIFQLWNKSATNQFTIFNQKSRNSFIISKVESYNRTNTNLENGTNLSSDWVTPEFVIGNNDEPFQLYANYSIIINQIDARLIPYISTKFCYRVGPSVPSAPVPVSTVDDTLPFDEDIGFLSFNEITKVEDIAGSTRYKKITYISSIFLEEGNGLPANLQFKFYFNLINPIYYQTYA